MRNNTGRNNAKMILLLFFSLPSYYYNHKFLSKSLLKYRIVPFYMFKHDNQMRVCKIDFECNPLNLDDDYLLGFYPYYMDRNMFGVHVSTLYKTI